MHLPAVRNLSAIIWEILEDYTMGVDWQQNEIWTEITVMIDVSFVDTVQLQFRGYGLGGRDKVYCDSVRLEGK